MASARREIGNSPAIGDGPPRRRTPDTLPTTCADRADRGVLCDTDGGPEVTTPPSDP